MSAMIERLRSPGTLVYIDSDVDGIALEPTYPTTVEHGDSVGQVLWEDGERIFDDAERAGFEIGAGCDFVWVSFRKGEEGWEYDQVDVEFGRLLKGESR